VESLESRSRALNQPRDVFRDRRTNQISHTSPLLDPPFPHHYHFICQPSRFGQIVRHQQCGDSEIAAKMVEALLQLRARNCVQRSEWLVEEDHAGAGRHAPRERHALALAAGQLVRKSRSELGRGKANKIERAPGGVGWVRHALKSRDQLDVAEHPPVGKQSAVLLHVADSAPQEYGRLCLNITFADHHFPVLRLYKPVEAAKKRGLSRAAFADECSRAARQNLDAYIIESDDTTEVMRDVARCERDRHCLKSDGSAAESLSPGLIVFARRHGFSGASSRRELARPENETNLRSRHFGVSVSVIPFSSN
jgi:hypothetical protein